MWHELLVAFALLLVVEGVWPFLNPGGLRRAMLAMSGESDPVLRTAGFVSMVIGVVMLYLVN